MSGPYESSGDALRDAAHVYDASRRQERRGTMGQVNEGLLLASLTEAGVQLGAYDRVIAGWLAGFEPETVQVVMGWIERAFDAGAVFVADGNPADTPKRATRPARALPTAEALLGLAADVMGLEAARDNAEQRIQEMIGQFDAIAALAHHLAELNPGGDIASVAGAIVRIAEVGDVPGVTVSALVDDVTYPVRLALLAARDRSEPDAVDEQQGDLSGLIERLFHQADTELDDEDADRQYTLEAVRDGLADALGLLGIEAGPTRAAADQADVDVAQAVSLAPTDPVALAAAAAVLDAEFPDGAVHYTRLFRGDALCGANRAASASSWREDVTCVACRALLLGRALFAGGAR
jgi:hypothetical protein